MNRNAALVLVVVSLCAISLRAAAADSRLGVWRGTLGADKVMLCLLDSPSAGAQYYFERDGRGIALTVNADLPQEWNESTDEEQGGGFSFGAVIGERMSGAWSDAEGARSLPVNLTRVLAAADGKALCMDNGPVGTAFNRPRFDAITLSNKSIGNGLRQLSALDGAISFVELSDDSVTAATFNRAMRQRHAEKLVDYFECGMAKYHDYSNQLQVELHNDGWLVLREQYEMSCGGPHPNSGIAGFQVWNLATGAAVEPWSWIRESRVPCEGHDCGYHAPAALNAVLVARATRNKDGDDCAELVDGNSTYLLHPTVSGLTFSTDFFHAMQACNEDIEVPYAELAPFLSEEGRQAVQSIVGRGTQTSK